MSDNKPIQRCYVAKDGDIIEATFSVFVGAKGDTYTGVRDEQANNFVTHRQYDAILKAFDGLSGEHKAIFKKEALYNTQKNASGLKLPSPLAQLSAAQRKGYEAALVAAGLADPRADAVGCHARNARDFDVIVDHTCGNDAGYNSRFYRVGQHRVPESSMTPGVISFAIGGNTYKNDRLMSSLKTEDPRAICKVLQNDFGKSAKEADTIASSPQTAKLIKSLKEEGPEIKAELHSSMHADGISKRPTAQSKQPNRAPRLGM